MSGSNKKVFTGPYRATKLWNDTVQSFYNGMPLGRHWRGLKQYENCFSASEAIQWLNKYLNDNPNFGPAVSKDQTIKLLRKFLKCGLIVGVRGNKLYPEDLQDNREIYRFGSQSPLKVLRSPSRIPLAPIITNGLINSHSSPVLPNKERKISSKVTSSHYENVKYDNEVNEAVKENFHHYKKAPFSEYQINNAWCDVYNQRMDLVCGKLLNEKGASLTKSSVLPNPTYIRQNLGVIPLPPPSQNSLSSDELPKWIFHAMKSLVQWPNSADSVCNIPNYPGVELDIFKVVRDYFTELVIPLVPFELYESIIRIYVGAEVLDISQRSPSSNKPLVIDSNLSSHDSVEDLMLDISIKASPKKLEDDVSTEYSHDEVFEGNLSGTIDGNSYMKTTPEIVKENWCSSIPRSLKLNRLDNYIDFKDEYLYPLGGEPSLTYVNNYAEANTTLISEKVTLRSLKNKARSLPKVANENRSQNGDVLYDKLLKSDELDDFYLPPNSCFETAFTSDSPKTRIIPQKSVDTIHIRNCRRALRPKSIAVSSMTNTVNEYEVDEDIKTKSNSSSLHSDFNRSLSEGNLTKSQPNDRDLGAHKLTTSNSSGNLNSKRNRIARSSFSKSSLAARVRDSIKRKKAKDGSQKSFCKNDKIKITENLYKKDPSFDVDTAVVPLSQNEACFSRRLRTKSGGYANLGLVLPMENNTKAFSTRHDNVLDSSNGSSSQLSRQSNPHLRASAVTPDSFSHSDYSSLHSKSQSSFASSNFSNTSSSSLRRPSRCRSATPNGCLSHSLSSTVNASLYHSALSGFTQTPPLRESTPCVDISSDRQFDIPQSFTSTPPELPKRKPLIRYTPKCSSSSSSPCYENLLDLSNSRLLSSSANELSDKWTDRVPFGSVSPYFSGGIWRHYHSSPSKRLVGRKSHFKTNKMPSSACVLGLLTKVGKDACVDALQLLMLNVEPVRRRKLRLLLKMMAKLSGNDRLQLNSNVEVSNRALMVKTFCRCILRSESERDYDEYLSQRIIALLMDNEAAIFAPPQDLAVLAHRKLTADAQLGALNPNGPKACTGNAVAFCDRVSPNTYRNQKLSGSMQFLFELLSQIVENEKLTEKEKRKKLKEFKLHYPEIYHMMYPPGKENELLVRPLHTKPSLKSLKKFASIKSLTRSKSIRI